MAAAKKSATTGPASGTGTRHAFDFLADAAGPLPPLCVVFGDDAFLKRLVKQQLRTQILGEDSDVPFATFEGDTAEWRDVADELSTVSLFGGKSKRLVILEKADKFVSAHRERLEDYAEKPHARSILVLDVGSWASNTRLYKAIDKQHQQIDCRLPQAARGKGVDEERLTRWLSHWAETQHRVVLPAAAARLLVELAGMELGILDQDLAKLALFVEPAGKITPELVQKVIGGWRTKTIWEIVDAAADGNAAEALRQLDLALQSGEPPQVLFGPISWSLRRFTVAARVFLHAERRGERMTLRSALEQAGFRPWPAQALPNAERQMKQLGRERAGKLLQWLLEADLAMKGSHSSPDQSRFVLERLFLRMARQPDRSPS